MILDGHIHIRDGAPDTAALAGRLEAAGVGGGVLISLPPATFSGGAATKPPSERLQNVLAWCQASPNLHPFYWIDPLDPDALEQVAAAASAGAKGFKIICDRYFPGDERVLAVLRAVAAARRPVLFHSGILWDGKPSSRYNRPAEFEALLEVDGLKFCLAHVSWPWCDECLAVYGKFLNAHSARPDLSVEMFIDLTPGTPVIYRKEVLGKLLTVGYDIENNLIFGTDCCANDYNVEWTKKWQWRDRGIYRKLHVKRALVRQIFAGNLRRFLGLATDKVEKTPLRQGE